jgi:FtsH-binding integral membrane protein
MDDKALLWHLYQDNRTQAQFHETQRVNGTGLIGGGAAVVISTISQDGQYSREDLPLAFVLIVIGLFGFFFCVKSYERMQLHLNRCRVFLDHLDALDDLHDLNAMKNEADRKTKQEFRFASRLKLRLFWQGVHVLIATAGLVFILRIFWRPMGL